MGFFSLWGKVRLRAEERPKSISDCPACLWGVMLPSAVGLFCNKCEHCDYKPSKDRATWARICPCSYCST